MHKSQYTPAEAHEYFKQLEEKDLSSQHKERARRYVSNRIVETQEVVEK